MSLSDAGVVNGWSGRGRALIRLGTKQLTVGTGIAISRVAGFLTGALVARRLGPDGFARYTVAFTILTSLMQVTSFADTWMISRWEDDRPSGGVRLTVWRIKSVSALLFAAAASVTAVAWPNGLTRIGTSGELLVVAMLAAGAGALTSSAASLYQAAGALRAYALVIVAGPCLGLLLAGALALRGETRPSVYVWSILGSYLPTALLARRRLLHSVRSDASERKMREALHFGGWVTVGSVAYVLFQRLDVFLLAALRPGPDVGIYGAAVRISMVGAVFGNTLTAVLMPAGSQAGTWVSPSQRRAYLNESVLGIAVMVAVLGSGILLAPWLTAVFFGEAYSGAAGPVAILLLSQILLVAQMPFYFAMYGLNGVRWIASLGAAQLVVTATAGYWLIGRVGADGAAWTNVVTYGMGAVVVAWFHLARGRVVGETA